MYFGEALETIVELLAALVYLIMILVIYRKNKSNLTPGTKAIIGFLVSVCITRSLIGFAHFFYDYIELDNVTILIYKVLAIINYGTLPSLFVLLAYIFKQKYVKACFYLGLIMQLVIGLFISIAYIGLIREGESVDLDAGALRPLALIWVATPLMVGIIFLISAAKEEGKTRKRNIIFSIGLIISSIFTGLDALLTTYALVMKLITMVGIVIFAYGALIIVEHESESTT